MDKKEYKKIVFGILGVGLFVVIALFCDCPLVMKEAAVSAGNSGKGAMIVMGSLLFAICWWIGGVTADWVTALLMVISWVAFKACEIPVAFGEFSSSTVWMIIGAFTIAAAVSKTGLLKRIALNMMCLFSPKFSSQVLALMLTGTVCSPLIPSSTAKGVLGGSMAFSTAEAMGYEKDCKGRCGLFVASWIGFGATVPAFLTGSAFSYIVKGYMPEGIGDSLTWMTWFVAMIPWLIIFLVIMYLAILFLYKPQDATSLNKSLFTEQLAQLGRMGRDEKITAIVLSLCLIFWILEKVIGVNATVTAVLGAVSLLVTGVLEPKEIQTRVNWGLIIFIGGVFCLGTRFKDMGISSWLSYMISPLLSGISSKILLIIALFVLVYIVRMFIASQAVVIGLGLGIMMPLMQSVGIHPFIVGLMVYMGCNVWFVLYQNTTYLASFGSMEGTIRAKDAAKACYVYAVVMILASLISLPYWSMLGYIN